MLSLLQMLHFIDAHTTFVLDLYRLSRDAHAGFPLLAAGPSFTLISLQVRGWFGSGEKTLKSAAQPKRDSKYLLPLV